MKVTTKSGRTVTTTLSHSHLIRRNQTVEPITGADLKVGMRIPVAKHIDNNNHRFIKKTVKINDIKYKLDFVNALLEEFLEFEPNTGDLLISEINIPEKINIDSSDILPSLEELVKDNFTQSEVSNPVDELNTNKNLSAEEMLEVMSNIENTVNFKSICRGLYMICFLPHTNKMIIW